MTYRIAPARAFGLGANPEFSGAPADDPRLARQYARIKSRYMARNVTPAQAPSVPGLLAAAARSLFPNDNVTGAGWFPDGRVGFDVIVANETRLGTVRQRNFQIGQQVGPRIGPGTELYDARTEWDWSDIKPAPGVPAAADSGQTVAAPPASVPSGGGFFSSKLAGIPVWALVGGVVVLGGVGAALSLRKPRAAAVTANKRRRAKRRRRSSRMKRAA